MENNAIIVGTFKEVIDIMDARTTVTVWVADDNNKQTRIGESVTPVYEVLTAMNNETTAFYQVKRYSVIALNITLTGTSILIKKGE